MTSIQCNMQSYVRYELSGLMKKNNCVTFSYSFILCIYSKAGGEKYNVVLLCKDYIHRMYQNNGSMHYAKNKETFCSLLFGCIDYYCSPCKLL